MIKSILFKAFRDGVMDYLLSLPSLELRSADLPFVFVLFAYYCAQQFRNLLFSYSFLLVGRWIAVDPTCKAYSRDKTLTQSSTWSIVACCLLTVDLYS